MNIEVNKKVVETVESVTLTMSLQEAHILKDKLGELHSRREGHMIFYAQYTDLVDKLPKE